MLRVVCCVASAGGAREPKAAATAPQGQKPPRRTPGLELRAERKRRLEPAIDGGATRAGADEAAQTQLGRELRGG